jgi:hypothetical protein
VHRERSGIVTSDAVNNTPIWRRRFTLGRGSSARARSWRTIVETSGLPAEVRAIVAGVVSRTRVRRSEKREIARELVAHFADAIASGADPASAIAAFGDPARAARLLRRSVIRNRGWLDLAVRRSAQAVALGVLASVAVYGILAARFALGKPTIAENPSAEINAKLAGVPADQLAWPAMKALIAPLGTYPGLATNTDRWPNYTPEDPEWPEVAATLDARRGVLDQLQAVAARPVLGAELTNAADAELMDALHRARTGEPWPASNAAADRLENPPMATVLLQHLGPIRSFARWFAADARRAVELRDAGRFLADVDAMLNLARLIRQPPGTIGELSSLAVEALALDRVRDGLRADLLEDRELTRLAHRVATPSASLGEALSADRLMYLDTVQRVYTDDGRGGGRLTPAGVRLLRDSSPGQSPAGPGGEDGKDLQAAVAPLNMAFEPDRRDVVAAYEAAFARAVTLAAQRPWERPADWRGEADDRWWVWAGRRVSSDAGVLVPVNEDALAPVIAAFDDAAIDRAGTLTAIALELFKRRQGRYPLTLAELTPDLLPAVPLDADGRALRYRLVGDRPVLYSIGHDGVDDGGTPARIDWNIQNRFALELERATAPSRPGVGGDWILYVRAWPLPTSN